MQTFMYSAALKNYVAPHSPQIHKGGPLGCFPLFGLSLVTSRGRREDCTCEQL